MAAAANNIEIPILPEETILSVIKDVTNVPFTANDLKIPTYNKLYPVYSGFICNLLNVSSEQTSQVPLHVMETVAHPELCIEEAAGHLLFIKSLEYLFKACCINNFSMNDLVTPTKKRTRKLLCAIVNFAQFYLQYESIKTDILTKLETLVKDQGIYTNKREVLRERIAISKAQKMDKQKAVQEMNLSAIKARQQETAAIKDQKKRNNNVVKGEVDELQNVLTVAKASKLIRQGKEAVDEHLTRGHNLAVKETLYNGFGEVAPSALELIIKIEEDAKTVQVMSNEIEKIKDRNIVQSIKLKNVMTDKQNMQRFIQRLTDKRNRYISKHDKKMELFNETQIKLNEKEAEVLLDVKDKTKKLSSIRAEMKQLTEQEMLERKEHNNVMKIMEEKRIALQKQVGRYDEKVAEKCGEFTLKLDDLKRVRLLRRVVSEDVTNLLILEAGSSAKLVLKLYAEMESSEIDEVDCV